MKALMFHCKNYEVEFKEFANRPKGINPEKVKDKKQSVKNTIVTFITVERNDPVEETSKKLSKEIEKFCREVKVSNAVICPFAHLSNDLADSKTGIKFFDLLEQELMKLKINVIRSHFGSDKSLLLDVIGHKGNVRFREFW